MCKRSTCCGILTSFSEILSIRHMVILVHVDSCCFCCLLLLLLLLLFVVVADVTVKRQS